jgi:hypothetical protein
VWYLVAYAWIVSFIALVLGHYRTAQLIAALAIIPDLVWLLQGEFADALQMPLGPWAFWILLNLVPVLAMTAFHQDAPPGQQQAAPVQYGFWITLPAADVPALMTVIPAPSGPPGLPPPELSPQLPPFPPSALPGAPGSSSASRHGSQTGSSKSFCPAGIKLSSCSAYWPRLAEAGDVMVYLGGPIGPRSASGRPR